MATITKRKRKDGTIAYRAEIRIKKYGRIIHAENKTFDKLALAKAWIVKREMELQHAAAYGVDKCVLVSELIERYLTQFGNQYGRSKVADLKRLLSYPIANLNAYDLQPKDLIAHCLMRKQTAKPQTVKNDIIWLRTVLRTMRDVDGHDYSLAVFDNTTPVLQREKLIANAAQRDRRPTANELWRLSRYFAYRRGKTPMLHIMWFAIYSARRLGEICALLWQDNNEENRTGIVRNLKHPTKKHGNHRRFKYPASAWKIVQKQPRVDDRIFPYNDKMISKIFTEACKFLEINDLHFHDLRHESVSRLFEKGLRIEQVQLISLHDSWKTLERYTNLRPEDLDI